MLKRLSKRHVERFLSLYNQWLYLKVWLKGYMSPQRHVYVCVACGWDIKGYYVIKAVDIQDGRCQFPQKHQVEGTYIRTIRTDNN